jgi:hypothetical protein
MIRNRLAFALAATSLLACCTALGWRLGPGLPCTRGDLFEAPPVVEHREQGYFLTWTQGEYLFFFEPSYEAMEGRLVFAVSATASSGNLAGRYREMEIEGEENIEALRRGGAVWWERGPEPPEPPGPNGRFVPLKLVEVGRTEDAPDRGSDRASAEAPDRTLTRQLAGYSFEPGVR